MITWVLDHPFKSALVLLLAVGVLITVINGKNQTPDWITATVTTGTVTEVVSVSGTVEATQSAELTFPANGTVAEIMTERGALVTPGSLLAVLGDTTVATERGEAVAALREAQARQTELQAGQTTQERAVTETQVANATEALDRAQALAIENVNTALINLRSVDLEAVTVQGDSRATAPTMSGNYTCTEDGTYTLEVYPSGAASGYSYRLSGLEGGTYSVTVDQPSALGDCGLFIKFTDGDSYGNTNWMIEVPNTRSATYIARKNAYTTALTQAEQSVAAARDALRLAESQADQATAGARVEALLAANAQVQQASARVATIDARLQDYALYAPFTGIVTDVLIEQGETVRGETAITLLNTDTFELTARIPEIDITRLAVGQTITATFDANQSEVVTGEITYVAPQAVEIDGVGYFEAVIEMQPTPDWVRVGLNADIDIAISESTNVARLPLRFVEFVDGTAYVYTVENGERTQQVVELGLRGNDGFVEVRNLPVNTEVIAP